MVGSHEQESGFGWPTPGVELLSHARSSENSKPPTPARRLLAMLGADVLIRRKRGALLEWGASGKLQVFITLFRTAVPLVGTNHHNST